MSKYNTNFAGLKKRETYEELVDFLENQPSIKYPDRSSRQLREHPVMTVLDGDGWLDLDDVNLNIQKEMVKEQLLRQFASDNSVEMGSVRSSHRRDPDPDAGMQADDLQFGTPSDIGYRQGVPPSDTSMRSNPRDVLSESVPRFNPRSLEGMFQDPLSDPQHLRDIALELGLEHEATSPVEASKETAPKKKAVKKKGKLTEEEKEANRQLKLAEKRAIKDSLKLEKARKKAELAKKKKQEKQDEKEFMKIQIEQLKKEEEEMKKGEAKSSTWTPVDPSAPALVWKPKAKAKAKSKPAPNQENLNKSP